MRKRDWERPKLKKGLPRLGSKFRFFYSFHLNFGARSFCGLVILLIHINRARSLATRPLRLTLGREY
jgi:hypothetical protein